MANHRKGGLRRSQNPGKILNDYQQRNQTITQNQGNPNQQAQEDGEWEDIDGALQPEPAERRVVRPSFKPKHPTSVSLKKEVIGYHFSVKGKDGDGNVISFGVGKVARGVTDKRQILEAVTPLLRARFNKEGLSPAEITYKLSMMNVELGQKIYATKPSKPLHAYARRATPLSYVVSHHALDSELKPTELTQGVVGILAHDPAFTLGHAIAIAQQDNNVNFQSSFSGLIHNTMGQIPVGNTSSTAGHTAYAQFALSRGNGDPAFDLTCQQRSTALPESNFNQLVTVCAQTGAALLSHLRGTYITETPSVSLTSHNAALCPGSAVLVTYHGASETDYNFGIVYSECPSDISSAMDMFASTGADFAGSSSEVLSSPPVGSTGKQMLLLPMNGFPPVIFSTPAPVATPTQAPTNATANATTTAAPTRSPTAFPTGIPTKAPTRFPTRFPTAKPSAQPTAIPTTGPTFSPTNSPSGAPTSKPTNAPTGTPSTPPTANPTQTPTMTPTGVPTNAPTLSPSNVPTPLPTQDPTANPTNAPSNAPTQVPTPAKLKPILRNDHLAGVQDKPSIFDVADDLLVNDDDPDKVIGAANNGLIASSFEVVDEVDTSLGVVTVDSTKEHITFTPKLGVTGNVTFTYRVQDADGLFGDPAKVTINVAAASGKNDDSGGGIPIIPIVAGGGAVIVIVGILAAACIARKHEEPIAHVIPAQKLMEEGCDPTNFALTTQSKDIKRFGSITYDTANKVVIFTPNRPKRGERNAVGVEQSEQVEFSYRYKNKKGDEVTKDFTFISPRDYSFVKNPSRAFAVDEAQAEEQSVNLPQGKIGETVYNSVYVEKYGEDRADKRPMRAFVYDGLLQEKQQHAWQESEVDPVVDKAAAARKALVAGGSHNDSGTSTMRPDSVPSSRRSSVSSEQGTEFSEPAASLALEPLPPSAHIVASREAVVEVPVPATEEPELESGSEALSLPGTPDISPASSPVSSKTSTPRSSIGSNAEPKPVTITPPVLPSPSNAAAMSAAMAYLPGIPLAVHRNETPSPPLEMFDGGSASSFGGEHDNEASQASDEELETSDVKEEPPAPPTAAAIVPTMSHEERVRALKQSMLDNAHELTGEVTTFNIYENTGLDKGRKATADTKGNLKQPYEYKVRIVDSVDAVDPHEGEVIYYLKDSHQLLMVPFNPYARRVGAGKAATDYMFGYRKDIILSTLSKCDKLGQLNLNHFLGEGVVGNHQTQYLVKDTKDEHLHEVTFDPNFLKILYETLGVEDRFEEKPKEKPQQKAVSGIMAKLQSAGIEDHMRAATAASLRQPKASEIQDYLERFTGQQQREALYKSANGEGAAIRCKRTITPELLQDFELGEVRAQDSDNLKIVYTALYGTDQYELKTRTKFARGGTESSKLHGSTTLVSPRTGEPISPPKSMPPLS